MKWSSVDVQCCFLKLVKFMEFGRNWKLSAYKSFWNLVLHPNTVQYGKFYGKLGIRKITFFISRAVAHVFLNVVESKNADYNANHCNWNLSSTNFANWLPEFVECWLFIFKHHWRTPLPPYFHIATTLFTSTFKNENYNCVWDDNSFF